jgi:hypothetical protein
MVGALAYATGRVAANVGREGRPSPAVSVGPGWLGRTTGATLDWLRAHAPALRHGGPAT